MEIGDFYEGLFQEVFSCLDRSEGEAACFICGHTSEEVYEALIKRFEEKYKEDQERLEEALVLTHSREFSFLTFRTIRPLCLPCYWRIAEVGTFVFEGQDEIIDILFSEVRTKGEALWPHPDEMDEIP